MKNKLIRIVKIIEVHYERNIAFAAPPINEIDMNLIRVATKIYDLIDRFASIEDMDLSISKLIFSTKQMFGIPLETKDIIKLICKDNIRYKVVMEVYNGLLHLRD